MHTYRSQEGCYKREYSSICIVIRHSWTLPPTRRLVLTEAAKTILLVALAWSIKNNARFLLHWVISLIKIILLEGASKTLYIYIIFQLQMNCIKDEIQHIYVSNWMTNSHKRAFLFWINKYITISFKSKITYIFYRRIKLSAVVVEEFWLIYHSCYAKFVKHYSV